MGSTMKKTGTRKSCWTVPLKVKNNVAANLPPTFPPLYVLYIQKIKENGAHNESFSLSRILRIW